MIHLSEKILLLGATSVEGAAIAKQLIRLGHPKDHLFLATASTIDWTNAQEVTRFLSGLLPDQVYLPARHFLTKVASDPISALTAKTAVLNIITCAAQLGIKKMLLLTGSEVYPSSRFPPYAEEDLLAGQVDQHASIDALVQIVAMKYCQEFSKPEGNSIDLDYRCIVLGDVYGHNYSDTTSPTGWITKIIQAIETAKIEAQRFAIIPMPADARLDLMYIDDMSEASVYTMEVPKAVFYGHTNQTHAHINIGSGHSIEAQRLVQFMATLLGYEGDFLYSDFYLEHSKQFKSLDTNRLSQLGWTPMIDIKQGIDIVCTDYLLHHNQFTDNV